MVAAVSAFEAPVRLQAQPAAPAEPGHGPTALLAVVAAAAAGGELAGRAARVADALLARPTDTTPAGSTAVRYSTPTSSLETPRFRVHYASSGPDAATPEFAARVGAALERTHQHQVGELGWRAPPSDQGLGGDARTDVYLAEVARHGFLAYAATDAGQSCRDQACGGFHGYLVIDNDFAGWPAPDDIMRVVVAHEYNHILQFGYSVLAEHWWMEATAEWMAVHTEPSLDFTSARMRQWGAASLTPLTDSEVSTGGRTKSYGSYVWNAWIERRHGPSVVRRAWELAARTAGFSLGAYDLALAERGSSFEREFVEFAASTANWAATGIPRAATFPEVHRLAELGSSQRVLLGATAFVHHDTAARGPLTATMSAPPGVAGGLGVTVVRADGRAETTVAGLAAGQARLSLDTAGAQRVTVTMVNADAREPLAGTVSPFAVTVSTQTPRPALASLLGTRIDGGGAADPVGQAVGTSRSLFDDGAAPRVVLATADRFPDALSAGALAGRRGPILFTAGLGPLDSRTAAEIRRVTGGRGEVVVLGGVAAVSEQAAQQARAAAGAAACATPLPADCRIAGGDREHTAALVARVVLAEHPGSRVLLARSDDFADALTGGAYAAATGTPVLLTAHDRLSPHVAGLLSEAGVREVVVLGGRAAVADEVVAALPVASRVRVAGADRAETAARIAAELWGAAGRGSGGALLVNVRHAEGWQTALSGSVASAILDAPQLAVEDPPVVLPAATLAALRGRGDGAVRAMGSQGLVSNEQLAAALAVR